jgi:mannose-6-phosphate isomerase-like protein (cupin superfamily)
MRKAFTGESAYTQKLFVSSFVLKPGSEVHPPHQHAQEEFMTVVEGAGVWHLDGKELPAKKGDVIYVAPWVWHGLKNTGDAPLVYFVAQWNPKAMAPAERPGR